MALNLDPRQRAMLQDMGITIWWPKPAAILPAPTLAAVPSSAVAVSSSHTAVPEPMASAPAVVQPTATAAPASVPVQRATPPVAVPPTETASTAIEWQISPAIQAYPAAAGGSADDAWLVLWECTNPASPLEGDTGKLLNNMLRALRLHHSPHVWIAGLQRPGHDALPVASLPAEPIAWQDLANGLPATIQTSRPARILVLGMHAARAALGSQEALGRLRAQVHQVHHIPTVVSYDPAYLLRSPHAKPAAWADLCRAHALRPPSTL